MSLPVLFNEVLIILSKIIYYICLLFFHPVSSDPTHLTDHFTKHTGGMNRNETTILMCLMKRRLCYRVHIYPEWFGC